MNAASGNLHGSRAANFDSQVKTVISRVKTVDSQVKTVTSRVKTVTSQVKTVDSRVKLVIRNGNARLLRPGGARRSHVQYLIRATFSLGSGFLARSHASLWVKDRPLIARAARYPFAVMGPLRRFVANNWPFRLWFALVVVAWARVFSQLCQPGLIPPSDWRSLLILLLLAAATLAVALLSGGILSSVLLAPIYLFQATINGAPFEPGDQVRILSGRRRGRVTRIYSKWQGGSYRVEIDETAKASDKDIYGGYELLRLPSAEQIAPSSK